MSQICDKCSVAYIVINNKWKIQSGIIDENLQWCMLHWQDVYFDIDTLILVIMPDITEVYNHWVLVDDVIILDWVHSACNMVIGKTNIQEALKFRI